MKSQSLVIGVLLLSLTLVFGCGGGGMSQTPDFALVAAPSAITITPGGASQTLSVTPSGINGFNGTVTVTLGPLPTGVTASPASVTVTPGTIGLFTITAGPSAKAGTTAISVTGTYGAIKHTASAALTVSLQQLTTASLNTTYFSFGDNIVNNTLTQTAVVVTNTGSIALTMNPELSGDASYSINSTTTCGQQLAAGANCDVVLNYTPTTASAPSTQDAILNLNFGNVPSGTPQTVAITGTSGSLSAGVVSATDNPQVALYTMNLPFPGSMTVNFGTTTSYGQATWAQSTSSTTGGPVSIFVAGMLGSTAYHMQAAVTFANGLTVKDTDHTFTTGAVPANMQFPIQTTTTAGMTPQPGLELLDGAQSGVVITDLSGNILWTYTDPGSPSLNGVGGVKMLPDGDLLMEIGGNVSPLSGPIPAGVINEIREVNLAGDTVREIAINDLNAELASATCAECNVSLDNFHHDVTPLPNGHWLVLGNTTMNLSPSTTPALTNEGTGTTTVLGDVIVDLDQNLKPVWVWNEFNHLDPNRHPWSFPDWTHTNAVVYSPDDGNIIVSIRHQNWVLKINYDNGAGDGSILWRLGEGGDFTLKNGTDPIDWQYAQHAPSFFSSNTSGVFSLGMMDNGDDRISTPPSSPDAINPTCGTTGAPACYSTIPVFQIDESAKTATLTFHLIVPPNLYNNWGGNAEQLANGDVEYDLNATPTGPHVFEVTQTSSPQTVWVLQETTTSLYRAFRIPSMYPGVQW
ncbi:MAG TPA: aryl-sulfate sulfotransferase [Acidobacteriaceae bacterium]|nr:aryl-sulfate sulfotransferase [Acidobacteriaceae bacterium]